VIRFSAFLVAVAVGLLIVGVVTSKLLLVYIAIGVSGLALLALGVGTVIRWSELSGKSKTAEPKTAEPETAEPEFSQPEPVGTHAPPAYSGAQLSPRPATVPAGSSWPAAAQAGPSLAGYLPADAMAAGGAAAAWGSGASAAGLPGARPGAPAVGPAAAKAAAATSAVGAAAAAAAAAAPTAPAPPGPPPPAATSAAAAGLTPAEVSPPAGAAGPDQVVSPARDQAAGRRAEESLLPAKDQPSVKDDRPAEGQPPAETRPAAGGQLLVQGEPPAEGRRQAPGNQQAPENHQAEGYKPRDEPVARAGVEAGTAPAEPGASQAASLAAEPTPAEADLQREVTVVPGVPRYHNARCILIRFMSEKDLDKMTLAAARKAGCTPCRACLPDQPGNLS